MLRSWRSFHIVVENHLKVIELYITNCWFYVAAQTFVYLRLRPTVTELDKTQIDVKYYLLQMKHRSIVFTHTVSSSSFRADGVYSFMSGRVCPVSLFTLSSTHTLKHALIHLLNQSYSQSNHSAD